MNSQNPFHPTKILALAGALFLALSSAWAQTKVACVGDSISAGYALKDPDTESYPAQLQALLGDAYSVGNFGLSGATLQKKSDYSYWETEQQKGSLEFSPDIVVIMLGTNDTKPWNWNADKFATDYRELISTYQNLDTQPKIYLCLPPPVYMPHPFGDAFAPDFVQENLIPAVRAIAVETGLELIDNNTPLRDRPKLFNDGVHPSVDGAGVIAINVAASLNPVESIAIWDGEIPGSIEKPEYQQTVDPNDGWVKMRFVTKPSLDVYPAPDDKANGTAVIICPGGGYWGLAIEHEGADVAKWLNSLGVTAFVLKYRLPDDAIMEDKSIGPMQDGQKAIRLVRRRADEWGIDPDRIGIMGFSAGGHLAATLSTRYDETVYPPIDATSARPDFSLLVYPVISMQSGITHEGSRWNLLGEQQTPERLTLYSNELQVDADTPPAFLVHSMDDGTVPAQNSIAYAQALAAVKTPSELHLYQSGGHGYGLGRSNDNTESTWPAACRKWLEVRGLLQRN